MKGTRTFDGNNYPAGTMPGTPTSWTSCPGYQPRGYARLDELAVLLGLPGKMDMSGADVWSRYLAGELDSIRDYCETDVLNTYLIYLRWELVRGRLDEARWQEECMRVRAALAASGREHLARFAQGRRHELRRRKRRARPRWKRSAWTGAALRA